MLSGDRSAISQLIINTPSYSHFNIMFLQFHVISISFNLKFRSFEKIMSFQIQVISNSDHSKFSFFNSRFQSFLICEKRLYHYQHIVHSIPFYSRSKFRSFQNSGHFKIQVISKFRSSGDRISISII